VNILDDRDSSVWMRTHGSAKVNSSTLSERLLSPLGGTMPPTTLATIHNTALHDIPSRCHDLGGKQGPVLRAEIPIIYGNVSDAWNADTTLNLPLTPTTALTLRIANDSKDTVSFTLCFPATTSLLVPLTCATTFLPNRTKRLDWPSHASPRSYTLGS